jgi:membrane protein involved in colicin uptake
MELTGFIAELREQHQRSVYRSRVVIFLMLLLIVLLLGAAAGLVQAIRMQMAERQYETARMQENMQKMASGFTAELQAQEKARQNERAEAARSIKSLQDELIRQQKARAAEAARLARQIAEDRKAWQKMQEKREKLLSEKSAAEQKILMDKMAEDARKSQAQLDAVKAELAAASKRLQELTGRLNQLNENGGIGGGAIAPSAAGVGPQVPAQNKVAQ